MNSTLSRIFASSARIPSIRTSRHTICRDESSSILASKAAKAVLKRDDKDVEKIPPLMPQSEIPASYQYIYPDFIADPDMTRRNLIREKLERQDMLKRRSVVDIPEFYVGSVLAVTLSDPHAPTKTSRFVGICVARGGHGLRAYCVLRNVVDGLGMEIMYELYNPTIRKYEVLKLERRLDDELFYLRDCAPEHSTFPFDMEMQLHPPGAAIPLNDTVLKLNPLPWKARWELLGFRGCTYEPFQRPFLIREKNFKIHMKPFAHEKYDILRKYRQRVPLEDQEEMFRDVYNFNNTQYEKRKSRR